MDTIVNLAIGLTLLVGALAGLAVELVVGAAGVLLGGFNLINAIRRRVKSYITLAVLWIVIYLGGHMIIAYLDPVFMSSWGVLWSILMLGLTAAIIWFGMGREGDLTAVLINLPDNVFAQIMTALENDTDAVTWPEWYEPVKRIMYFLRGTGRFSKSTIRVILPLWRDLGDKLFGIAKTLYMIGILAAVYFVLVLPSGSWVWFGITIIAWAGYLVCGLTFNWNLWRQVIILTLIVGIGITMTAPIWRSFMLPLNQYITGPLTSAYGLITQDATIWSHSWSKGSTPSGTISASTWVLITNSTPEFDRDTGITVVRVRPANPGDPALNGFARTEFTVAAQAVERRSSLPTTSAATSISLFSNPRALVAIFFCGLGLFLALFFTRSTSTSSH